MECCCGAGARSKGPCPWRRRSLLGLSRHPSAARPQGLLRETVARRYRLVLWRLSNGGFTRYAFFIPQIARLCPTMDAKLATDSFDVRLDGGLCAIKCRRAAIVRIPFNKAAHNKLLSWRKLR